MRFLPRQQVQRQADSKRPRNSGGCQRAGGQQSDTQVRLQTEHQEQKTSQLAQISLFMHDTARYHIVCVSHLFPPDDASLQSCMVQIIWPCKNGHLGLFCRTSQSNTFTQYAPREFNAKEKESLLQLQSLRRFCHTMTPR